MNWIVDLLVKWLVANLTPELIQKCVDAIKAWAIPFLRKQKADIIAKLRAAAADTSNPLDDAAVDALDKLLEAFMPDVPEVL